MSAEPIPGFNRAQSQWENLGPYDDDCICVEDDLVVCDECGLPWPDDGECEDEPCEPRPATDWEKAEFHPVQGCREHGWCGGCSSPKCEDCGV